MLNTVVLRVPDAREWLVFTEPVEILTAAHPAAVPAVLREVEQRVLREGLFAAGFIGYEAASGFDPAFKTHGSADMPALCFGLFSEPRRLSTFSPARNEAQASWEVAVAHRAYLEAIDAIKQEIARGNTYQVNYTVRLRAENISDPWAMFLNVAADAPYAAYVDTQDHAIVSGSPELFFSLKGEQLVCKPMKGTAKRGMTLSEDCGLRQWLIASEKNRAENIMITDMVRNDLGRIAAPGSINVSEMCSVDKYPTVWQMTSTVTARSNASISDVLGALFPSASVTGAPKISSMRTIADLEGTPRDIYTGTIGYMAPERKAQFNVAIRTACVDKRVGTAVYGVGGGIVADSEPQEEYQECLTKTRIITSEPRNREFELLETMRWTPEESYFLIEYHVARMRDSAEYFEFKFDRSDIDNALRALSENFLAGPYRIRLTLRKDGRFRATHEPLSVDSQAGPQRVRLAAYPIDAENPFLYHKTTNRQKYEDALSSISDCDDVLLWNVDGYITETSIANVVVQIDGKLVTPSSHCGLLCGTYRQWLLDEGEIEEQNVHIDDLRRAEGIVLINSVRGRYAARLCEGAAGSIRANTSVSY